MASLRAERGRLFLDFRWRSVRCREWTGRSDTPAGRAECKKLLRQIDGEIAAGTFDYARRFPHGLQQKRFAPPASQSTDAPAGFAAEARTWLEHRRPWLAGGTQYDYERILEAHLIPHFGDRVISTIHVDDVEQFVGASSKSLGARLRRFLIDAST
jgi:integrase